MGEDRANDSGILDGGDQVQPMSFGKTPTSEPSIDLGADPKPISAP
jgi:hypothetical protein